MVKINSMRSRNEIHLYRNQFRGSNVEGEKEVYC